MTSSLFTSVPVLLEQRAARDPDGVLIQEVGGKTYRNAEFHRAAIGVADALATLGVARGDRVATMLDPDILGHICWIGMAWLKALEAPINPEFRGATLVHALNDPGAQILITSNQLLPRVEAVREQLTALREILTIDDTVPESPLPVRTLASVIADARPHTHEPPVESDPYAVIYTSGTTGPSKGVVVPWASVQAAIDTQLFAGDDIESYADPAFYSPWPTFHSSGKTGIVFAAQKNARMVFRKRLSISTYWQDIGDYGCTHTQILGLAGLLLNQPPRPEDADTPLKCVLMNPVIPQFREFEKRFGVTVSTGWGMTEIGFPTAAGNLPNAETCGKLSPLYEARIVDDNDYEVPEGEVGQLIIRSHRPWLMMTEYLGRPEATAKAWRNGWFHTGDALRRDADGYYYFVDRVADYLRTRGNNVSSMEVEAEVRGHPDIEDCAAVGVPSSIAAADKDSMNQQKKVSLDDDIKIVATLVEGSTLTPEALLRYLIPRMPRFMVPRYIEFVSEMPRTPTGKIQKKVLRSDPFNAGTWDREAAGIEVPR